MKEPNKSLAPTADNKALGILMFKDPSEYAHMSQEEKEELTGKMIQSHRAWSAGKLKG